MSAAACIDAMVYAGVADALEQLRAAGCRLSVATAKPHHYARPILERFDLARRFAGIHGPLDGTHDHKHDLIADIARTRGRPEKAIMVGDREFDVIAAARNGIRPRRHLGLWQPRRTARRWAASICDAPCQLAPPDFGRRQIISTACLRLGRPLGPCWSNCRISARGSGQGAGARRGRLPHS